MILIDPIRRYPRGPRGFRHWCHMMTDDLTDRGLEELQSFALQLGLRLEWIHRHERLPHYDLTPPLRELALTLGAQSVSSREQVLRCRRLASH